MVLDPFLQSSEYCVPRGYVVDHGYTLLSLKNGDFLAMSVCVW